MKNRKENFRNSNITRSNPMTTKILFVFFTFLSASLFAADNAEETLLKPCVPFGEQLALTGVTVTAAAYQVPQSAAPHIAAVMKAREALKPQAEQYTNEQIYQKAMGTPSRAALEKANWNLEEYIKTRGIKSIAGKAFEARTAIRVNRYFQNHGMADQIRITALDNMPGHSADLVLYDKAGRSGERYQLKLGRNAAYDAVSNPKYRGMKIITPPDELQKIKGDLRKEMLKAQSRGKSLPQKWQKIATAIDDGVLADNICGCRVSTVKQIEGSARYWIKTQIFKIIEAMKKLPIKYEARNQPQNKRDYTPIYKDGGVQKPNKVLAGLGSRGLFASGIGGGIATAIDAVTQYTQSGEVNIRQTVTVGGITAGSVYVGNYAGTQVSLLLVNKTPIYANAGGTLAGGSAASILMAGGMYLAGVIDAKQAVSMGTQGVIISVVASGASAAAVAGTMTVAVMFGTSGTGVAISSLSGAAATNAALAWLGGGTIVGGGTGIAGGTAFLTTIGTGVGVFVVAIPIIYMTYKYFKNEADSHRYLTGIVEITRKRVEAGKQPEWLPKN
jgi:hypothetical protein